MLFEWDEVKSERNRRERGFDFIAAAEVFDGALVEWCDIRADWGEVRIVAVGMVRGELLAVVYTDRGEARRIISARKARRMERELWRSCARP